MLPGWINVKSNICYDDLNIADFVREYVVGDLYKLLLHDRAPIIELVTNHDLQKKRFINGNDQFQEQVAKEKICDQLYLRSKFLNEFTTLMSLKEKNEDYRDIDGFEKIFAAQILLGEGDIAQPENFGIVEKEYEDAEGKIIKEKLWAKIDHGRSLCYCVNHCSQIELNDFTFRYGIKVDYKILASELSNYVKFFSEDSELLDRLIDKKTAHLNQFLNPEMKFTLRYISSNVSAVFCEEKFSYSKQSKEFISDKGNTLNQ